MRVNPLTLGTFLLILGMISCQFGLLLVLHQASLVDFVLNIMPLQLVEVSGVALQFLGSALIALGIATLVNGITAEVTRDQARRLSEALPRNEEIIEELSIQNIKRTNTCRFCGAPIMAEDIFCSICGRSQK
jgi:hypothetical protein